jgi:hypothetical protein
VWSPPATEFKRRENGYLNVTKLQFSLLKKKFKVLNPIKSSSSSALQPWVGLGLFLRFSNNIILRGGVVSLTPNPQPGGPEYPL